MYKNKCASVYYMYMYKFNTTTHILHCSLFYLSKKLIKFDQCV